MQIISSIFLILFFAAFAGIIKPYIGNLTRWQFAVAAFISAMICGATAPTPPESSPTEIEDGELVQPDQELAVEEKSDLAQTPAQANKIRQPQASSTTNLAKRIGADAISSYSEADRKHYPKLFETLGNRIFEVEKFGRKAAFLALQTGKCDRVLFVDVSSRSSRNDLHFYVDCDNETRVRVTESQIKAGEVQSAETKQERQRRIANRNARYDRLISNAKASVRAGLRDPSSAEFGNVFVSEKDGLVTCGFVNARNGFGGMTGKQGFIAFSNRIATATEANFKALWERHCTI